MTPSQARKTAARHVLAQFDMVHAMNACDGIQTHVKDIREPLFLPLFTAVVVLYARPFTKNNRYGGFHRNWPRFAGRQEYQSLHDKLLHLRSKAIAHSEALESVALESSDHVQAPCLDLEEIPRIRELCFELFNQFQPKLDEARAILFPGRRYS